MPSRRAPLDASSQQASQDAVAARTRRNGRLPALLVAIVLVLALYASAAWGQAPTLLQSMNAFGGTTAVGNSTTLPVTITFSGNGVVTSIETLTNGVSDQGGTQTALDFSVSDKGTCALLTVATTSGTCTLTVTFHPTYPGRRDGAIRIKALDGSLLGQALVTARASGALPVLKPGRIDTVAGTVGWTYLSDNVPGTAANIFTPKSALIDGAGNLYIADTGNSRIREVNAKTTLISTIAGTGSPTYSGDNGPATAAAISGPAGLLMDGAGNLYFSDRQNSVVRRIDAFTGTITTVAGVGLTPGYNGDGIAANTAQLNLPESLAFDLHGNLLIADTGNNRIRLVDASTGAISTVAGTGAGTYAGEGQIATNAPLYGPTGVAVAGDGSILIADNGNNRIRKIGSDNKLNTVVGTGIQGISPDGTAALQTELNQPINVALDPAGNIYITDSGNNRVRMVNAATGNIETLAGGDSEGFAGDTGPANLATFYGPYGLFLAPTGDVYLTDMFHMRVRRISASTLTLNYPVMRVSKTSAPQATGLINDGDLPLQLSAPVFNDSALDSATTTCFGNSAGALNPATQCNLGVEFTPTQIGNPRTGTLDLPSTGTNVTPEITLSGQVLSVNPTTVAVSVLSPSTNPSILGDTVALQAAVTSDDKGRTGTVTFNVDGSPVCVAVTLSATGTANCSVSGLGLGSHLVKASYSGDAQNASSISAPYTQVVKQKVTLSLTASPSTTTVVTKQVTFTIAASAATGVPTGTVNFFDGTASLGTATLDGGSATFATSSLALGRHSITVQYSGDAADAAGTSPVLTQTIRQGSTATSVGSSNTLSPVGQTVNLQANVTSLDGLVPTGTVTFANGKTALGTATVQTDGSASLSLANLLAGTYSIVATYNGDTNDAASSSPALTQTVTKLPTQTSLATDAAVLSAGAPLKLTAQTTIAPGATPYGVIDGTVTFTDNGATLGTAPVASDGSATFTALGLSVGSHTLTATYGGNANYAVSGGTYTQTVVQTASSIVLTAGASTVFAGKPAQLVASVSSSTGFPTGSVAFQEGSTTVGTALLVKGVATFSTTLLAAGQHSITATYQGDANYLQVTSSPVNLNIVLAQTSLALTGPGSAVTVTTAARFSAALSTEGVAPTGTLTLLDGANVVASQHLTGAGVFSFTLSTLSVGTHTLSARYSGDANNSFATSAAVTVQVNLAATATSLATSVTPAVIGTQVNFTAVVTSSVGNLTGTVNLLENGAVIGSAPVANGTAVISLSNLAFGKHMLTARYVGDAQHAASNSSTVQQAITEPATVNLSSSLNPSISGQTVTFAVVTPAVNGMTPTGTVVFTDGGTVLATMSLSSAGKASMQTSTLGVGSHSIQATYSGDTNFSGAQASLSQLVKISTTRVTETVGANPATFGSVADLTATITSDGGVATGSVQFTEAGATLGTAVLDGSGVAVLHLTTLKPGPHSVTAVYAGDGKAGPSSSGALSFLVKQLTTLTVSSDGNPGLTLNPVVLTATLQNSNAAVATGNIVFLDGGKTIGTTALNGNGVATLSLAPLPAGTHTITTTYAGDAANFAAASPALSQQVNLRATQTSVSASATSLNDSQQVTLIVIVQSPTASTAALPGGQVTLYNGTTAIGTVALDSNGTATFTTRLEASQTGTYSASYAGDANYAASTSGSTSFQSGLAAQFSLAVSNTNVTVARAQRMVVNVTAASVKGFSDSLKLGCVGLPYAATCTFTTMTGTVQTAMALPSNGSGTMQLTIDTGDPLGAGSEKQSSMLTTGRGAVLCLLPACFVLLGQKRRRRMLPLLLALFAFAMTLGVSGCGGLKVNSTPAGTYTFQVTAVGQSSGVTESQTVTLTVGQ